MKYFAFLGLYMIFYGITFAQQNPCDTIILNTGEKLIGKVVEITTSEIRYKKCNNLDGPVYLVNKSDVERINYLDGMGLKHSDVFTKKIQPKKTVLLYQKEGKATKREIRKINRRKISDEEFSSTKTSFVYINLAQLIFISEPNLGYEWRMKNNLGLNFNAGYKFYNVLGFASNMNSLGGGSVSYAYMGPRINLTLKYYFPKNKFFYGPHIRASYLTITNQSFSDGAKTVAGHLYGLKSERSDLDLGIMFGKTDFRDWSKLQVYIIIGLRNVWANSTYRRQTYGASGIGGAVVPFTNPVVNGYMSYGLFQLGLTFSFLEGKNRKGK